MSFDKNLEKYAEVIVKVGLNIQPGQRLFIGSPSFGKGTSFEPNTVALVRKITQKAYEAGSSLVSVLWGDDELAKIRLNCADANTLDNFETWRIDSMVGGIDERAAIVRITSTAPDTFSEFDADLISKMEGVSSAQMPRYRQAIGHNKTHWLVTAAPSPGWAKLVFPDDTSDDGVAKLWDAIFTICRATTVDPYQAWVEHVQNLMTRSNYLNEKNYDALHFTGPGTDLTIGLIQDHVWSSASHRDAQNMAHVVNIPTEEVYTTPDKMRVNGTARSTMPLSYAGTIIDDFSLTFKDGVVVGAKAGKGEKILKQMIAQDAGANRLGEVALVPFSSPISQSGILFYNTLYDENASCHVALGSAYKMVRDADSISMDEFYERGGNNSIIHVDFMIGSDQINIEGVWADGSSEPVMQNGEWAFDA